MKDTSVIRLLIASDFEILREGLKKIFAETSEILVQDEVSNSRQLSLEIPKNDYDVVLLDILMSDHKRLDLIKEIKTKNPKIPILVLNIVHQEDWAVRALKAGASGYLVKTCSTDELMAAIKKIAQGRKHISAVVAESLTYHLENNINKAPHDRLSNREFQVVCMMAEGKAMQEIADELSLSIKTINTYRSRILEKLKLKNNGQIIRYALKEGLVD